MTKGIITRAINFVKRKIKEEKCRFFHKKYWVKEYFMGLHYTAICNKCHLEWKGWDDAC